MTVRPPAVAGMFYDSRPDRLEKDVRGFLAVDASPADAIGVIAPHAGYVYSGAVAGAVYAHVRVPATCVILCPNHTGRGAPASVEPSDAWRTPLGDVRVDRAMADRLRELAPSLTEDAEAHRTRALPRGAAPLPPDRSARTSPSFPSASASRASRSAERSARRSRGSARSRRSRRSSSRPPT